MTSAVRWAVMVTGTLWLLNPLAERVLAAGGTSIVARAGSPAHVPASWPEGAAELVNDPARTHGWNAWFTEWPNDVNQYAMEVTSMEDLNRLVQKLAAVKSDIRQIRLSHLKEPASLGWVTRLPRDNKIPVIFSMGDQSRINKWYENVRKPFGQMEFVAAPVAVPPTLTIFVQHDLVKLDELSVPEGIVVEHGYVPTVFHRANTKAELALESTANAARANEPNLEADEKQAWDAIQAFIEKQKAAKGDVRPD